MFYSTQILSKKGALGTIWIASHLEKRLKRAQIFETSIPASVDSIINPEAPLALRLSGQLLLGIVRVYFRKLDYLSKDAQNAVDNLNKSQSQGVNVDLEDEGRAAYGAITLAEPPGGELGDDAFMFQPGAVSGGLLDSSRGGVGGGFAPVYSHGDSLAAVEDVSELFGSQWAIEEEKFPDSGEEVDRRYSIELERLRREAPARSDLFFPTREDEDTIPVPDELMAVPGEDYFAMGGPAATPAKTPLPEPPSAGGGPEAQLAGELPLTPPSIGGLDMLPDVGGGPTGSGGTFHTFDDAHTDDATTQQTPLSAARQRAAEARGQEGPSPAAQQKQKQLPRRRKKAAQVDVDDQGQPSTTLPVKEIRTLLNDRAPLMRPRGLGSIGGQAAAPPPDRFDVVAQSEEAQQSLLFRPTAFSTLAPELLEVYTRGMCVGGAAGPATPLRPGAAAAAAGEDPAGVGAAAGGVEGPASLGRGEQELEGPEAPFSPGGLLSAGDFSGGADFEFNPSSAGPADELPPPDYELDLIEPNTQPEALFPAGPEEGAGPGPSAGRASLAGQLGPLGEGEEEERSEGSEDLAAQLPKDSFTERSRRVLAEYRRRFVPGTGTKRRHPSAGGLAAKQLSLFEVVEGQPRLEACRWFYETLVLCKNDYVELQQQEAYGDITINAKPKMASLEGATPPA